MSLKKKQITIKCNILKFSEINVLFSYRTDKFSWKAGYFSPLNQYFRVTSSAVSAAGAPKVWFICALMGSSPVASAHSL